MNFIEPLESRIAPASLVQFTDVDGDQVIVTISAIDPHPVVASNLIPTGALGGSQLTLLDLSSPTANHANVSVSVTKAATGDGLVNIGRINAGANDLGTITIPGDLGDIDAGSGSKSTPAIKSLSALSMGIYGLVTQNGAGNLESDINGALGALKVVGDVKDAFLAVSHGKIGSITIGGSLIGGTAHTGGNITALDAGIGMVKIGGDILGGGDPTSGAIAAKGNIAGISVGGSVLGGSGFTSGVIFSSTGSVGPLTIGGDLGKGTATFTGRVFASTKLGNVTVGSSLLGGTMNDSGRIHSDGSIGMVKIAGDITGGGGLRSGNIDAGTTLAGVTVGGSLVGGSMEESGRIHSVKAMGAVKIGGNVSGGGAAGTGSINSDDVLGAVTVGGSLVGGSGNVTNLLGGSGTIQGQLALASVKVGFDLRGSSGNGSGVIYGGKLGSVTVGGSVVGGGGDSSGNISGGVIGSVKIGQDLIGGAGGFSARIQGGFRGIGSVTIGGSFIGGSFSDNTQHLRSGEIFVLGNLGTVKIGRDLVGGSVSGTANSVECGAIFIQDGRIGSVFIGGSIISGTDNSTKSSAFGDLISDASIRAGLDIGSLVVKGSIIGHASTGTGRSPVIISAGGQAKPSASADVAIGSLSVGGHVEQARILAGYVNDFAATDFIKPMDGNAQIGKIIVGTDFIASDLVAGVVDTGADGFGNGTETLIAGGTIAKIASIVIKGAILGTAAAGDHFGIESHTISKFSAGGINFPLKPGPPADVIDFSAGAHFDVTLREI
ncbi:MAG: hypothetical protein QOD99_1282 [Chthoniobacter sp.]|nr:hypothetical protein [Chthoniobacter sp.]